jgi:transposase-like protein
VGRHKKHSQGFKRGVWAHAESGTHSIAKLERELEIAQELVCRWMRRYRVSEEGVEHGASSQIREQLS